MINKLFHKVRRNLDKRKYAVDFNYSQSKNKTVAEKNIVFCVPSISYPVGGIIVTHNYSEYIELNKLGNFNSSILHPYNPAFKPTIFNSKVTYKRNNSFDPKADFVVLPELYAARHAPALAKMRVPYAISVLNGYLMDFERAQHNRSYSQIDFAYKHASIICGISDDTIENINFVFPEHESKVIKATYIIDKAVFKNWNQKPNVISYMPRKLAKHTELMLFMINKKLPSGWILKPIDGVSEEEIYKILTDTKIFLSFSEFEGLAMPPVMAALSGAHVIGYTGEGNKEYFNLSCFTEINCGDIKKMISETMEVAKLMDDNVYENDLNAIEILSDKFSKHNQLNFLSEFVRRVDTSFV